jgi:hypothetical protein
MRLTWKDTAATVLTAAIVALYVAFLVDANLPLVSGPRALAGVVLIAGLAACAIGGRSMTADTRHGWVVRISVVLGVVAFISALITMITGSEFVLAMVVGTTVALWLVTTLRHALTGVRRERVNDADLRRLTERDAGIRPRG